MKKAKLLLLAIILVPALSWAQSTGILQRMFIDKDVISIEYKPVTNLQNYINNILINKKTIPLKFTGEVKKVSFMLNDTLTVEDVKTIVYKNKHDLIGIDSTNQVLSISKASPELYIQKQFNIKFPN